MNFYKNAALALDHLDKHQGSVKGSLNAAGIDCTPGESKRLLACKRLLPRGMDEADDVVVIETLKCKYLPRS